MIHTVSAPASRADDCFLRGSWLRSRALLLASTPRTRKSSIRVRLVVLTADYNSNGGHDDDFEDLRLFSFFVRAWRCVGCRHQTKRFGDDYSGRPRRRSRSDSRAYRQHLPGIYQERRGGPARDALRELARLSG